MESLCHQQLVKRSRTGDITSTNEVADPAAPPIGPDDDVPE
jgi:hypothetical protein